MCLKIISNERHRLWQKQNRLPLLNDRKMLGIRIACSFDLGKAYGSRKDPQGKS